MCTTKNIDVRTCPYCHSNHTGVKDSTEGKNGLRKQKRICLDCKRNYYFFFKERQIVAAMDDQGNSIIEDTTTGE